MYQLIDTHAHLDELLELDQALAEAKSANVIAIIAVGTDYESNKKVLQIAQAYKLRWNIENFFAWWKRHLKVYHLIARSSYGLMVQILSGLITYLLLAIYCQKNFQEKVSIRRVRQLRTQIENELRCWPRGAKLQQYEKEQKLQSVNAKT